MNKTCLFSKNTKIKSCQIKFLLTLSKRKHTYVFKPMVRDKRENNMYTPKQNLVFTEDKLMILDSTKTHQIQIISIVYKLMYGGMAVGVALGGLSFFYGLIIKGIFCNGTAAFLYLVRRNSQQNNSRIISEIKLLKSGKEIEINTIKGKFYVDIHLLRKPNKIELLNLLKCNPASSRNFIPIVIESGPNFGFYYLPDSSEEKTRYNPELLSAILNGANIHISTKNSISEDKNIINI